MVSPLRFPPPCTAHRALVTAFAGCLLLALFGCGGGQAAPPSAADQCNDVELQVERVWSAGVKAQVMEKGGALEAEARKSVANKMDSISEDWVRLRLAVCNDYYKRKMISQADYEHQVKCFDDRLDQQRKLVTMIKGDVAAADKVATALLETPNACK